MAIDSTSSEQTMPETILKSASTLHCRGIISAKRSTTYKAPNFTINDVRKAVPEHCWRKSTTISLGYVVMDLLLICGLVFAATKIQSLPAYLQPFSWCLYWVLQALPGVGIWILAHECGHGAFSDHALLNHSVGLILHSIVLIPFFSWKFTHAKHHKATGHFEKEMVFIPSTRAEVSARFNVEKTVAPSPSLAHSITEALIEESPIMSMLVITAISIVGFPSYLAFNFGGQSYYGKDMKRKFVSHYLPESVVFDPIHYAGVMVSNAGLVAWVSILASIGYSYGWVYPVAYFVIPWIQVNMWLVLITFLQHTDPKAPHYSASEWTFLKGALATVDRDWGLLNVFFHHITDTHVVHHMFSGMPFYHAQEATEAVKGVLGEHYLFDETSLFQAFYNNWRDCRFVDIDEGVMWYKQ